MHCSNFVSVFDYLVSAHERRRTAHASEAFNYDEAYSNGELASMANNAHERQRTFFNHIRLNTEIKSSAP